MNPNVQTPGMLRICGIAVGYLIAIFGALSVFTLPLTVAFLALLTGFGVVVLASLRGYSSPPFTWRAWLVWLAGSALLLGVSWLIGEDTVRHWTPHPAGYQIAWFFGYSMFRHLRHIISSSASAPHAA